jgi:hypothetical protein
MFISLSEMFPMARKMLWNSEIKDFRPQMLFLRPPIIPESKRGKKGRDAKDQKLIFYQVDTGHQPFYLVSIKG